MSLGVPSIVLLAIAMLVARNRGWGTGNHSLLMAEHAATHFPKIVYERISSYLRAG